MQRRVTNPRGRSALGCMAELQTNSLKGKAVWRTAVPEVHWHACPHYKCMHWHATPCYTLPCNKCIAIPNTCVEMQGRVAHFRAKSALGMHDAIAKQCIAGVAKLFTNSLYINRRLLRIHLLHMHLLHTHLTMQESPNAFTKSLCINRRIARMHLLHTHLLHTHYNAGVAKCFTKRFA